MCAGGQLLSDLRHDFVRSYVAPLEKLNFTTANQLYREMKEQANQTLREDGIPDQKMSLSFSVDARYIGQFSEVEVQIKEHLLTKKNAEKLSQDFHKKHQSLNGYNMPFTPLEIVNLRVVAKGITDKPHKKIKLPSPNINSSDKALTGHRKAFFGDEFKDTPVYDGLQLSPGSTVLGPALLEQETTTVMVQPNFQLTCDELGNYLVYHKKQSLKKTISVLIKKGSNES